jgi:hypothetical protein
VLVCKMRVSLSLAQPWEIICLPGSLSVCLLVRLCSSVSTGGCLWRRRDQHARASEVLWVSEVLRVRSGLW